MRIRLDQAMNLGMIRHNPARQVSLHQPKKLQERRIMTPEEVQWLLATSLQHRHWIHGGLPTVVRLGLYAGLRNQEMAWLKWECIGWECRPGRGQPRRRSSRRRRLPNPERAGK